MNLNIAPLPTMSVPALAIDWAALSPLQARDYFCEQGFLLLPQVLSPAEVNELLQGIAQHGFSGFEEALWEIAACVRLITNARVLATLRLLLGDDLRFFKAAYLEAPPGRERQQLHLDQDTASYPGDARNTAASWVNVGFYLTDLTPQCAPLLVVPQSNKRYQLVPGSDLEYLMDEARLVLARAGDAVLFHRSTVHGGGANTTDVTRHGIFLSYRPAWAKPTGPVPAWQQSLLDKIEVSERALLAG